MNEETWDGRSIAVYSPMEKNIAQLSEMLELRIAVVDRIAKRFADR
jgi:histone H3/H4